MLPTLKVLRPRSLALAMYFAYLFAGIIFVFLPTAPGRPRPDVNLLSIVVWHSFLIIGSTTSCMGVIRKKPALEAVGIPLLVSTLMSYVVILLMGDAPSGTRFGLSLLFLGNVAGLVGRMIEMLRLARIATELERRGE